MNDCNECGHTPVDRIDSILHRLYCTGDIWPTEDVRTDHYTTRDNGE